jgi:hypothetical protein
MLIVPLTLHVQFTLFHYYMVIIVQSHQNIHTLILKETVLYAQRLKRSVIYINAMNRVKLKAICSVCKRR